MSPHNWAVEALGVAVAARVPVLLWGAPGTGKTSAIRAMAQTMGLPCETVIASIREPSDFAGLPIVVGDGVRFAPPAWARRLADAGHGLLFLDELSTAPPAVQAALLRVVLERVVGDLTLPDEVAVVAAANPPEQAADGWDLSAPLANRLCHLAWHTDPRSVADGLAGGWAPPVVPVLPDGWQAEEILSRGLVAAFLHVRPALACAPPSDAASAGRGWPSPRTWEMAARLMAAAGASGTGDEARSALIRGAVGDGAGVEFLAWLVEMDLPDPEQVLADPASFRLPERGAGPTPPSPRSPPRWPRTRRRTAGRQAGRSSAWPQTPRPTWPPSPRACWPSAAPTAPRCPRRSTCSPPSCATPASGVTHSG